MQNPRVHKVQEKPVMRMINKYNIAELSLVEYIAYFITQIVVLYKEQEQVSVLQSIVSQVITIRETSIPQTMSSLDSHRSEEQIK